MRQALNIRIRIFYPTGKSPFFICGCCANRHQKSDRLPMNERRYCPTKQVNYMFLPRRAQMYACCLRKNACCYCLRSGHCCYCLTNGRCCWTKRANGRFPKMKW